jgi:predicted membrane protein
MSDMLDNTFDKVKYSETDFSDTNIWMELLRKEVEVATVNGSDMGSLEKLIEKKIKELALPMLNYGAQLVADNQQMLCPHCGGKLKTEENNRKRTVKTVFGEITVERSYGYCEDCRKHSYPADKTLGLHERATGSPRVQEICSLSVLRTPAGRAPEDVKRMTGLDFSPSTLHREARRQGERALCLRDADVALTNTAEGVKELSRLSCPQTTDSGYTMVIEIDAWNIRERDNWGLTKELLLKGEDTKRWHWVYSGTVFRLDHRGESINGRSFITERGYVATRLGVDALEKQLYAEALRRGLQNAKYVLVIADGAIWIWNLAENRFKDATHRVDLWHVIEHLWAIANDMFGKGTPEAAKWAKQHISYLRLRSNGSLDVISSLCDIRDNTGGLTEKQQKTVEREIGYFNRHVNRMDYKNGKQLKQPLGSGAMESTCSQYQCRFKRTGQFWSLAGDEAFLALQTLHWNERWHLLFPHDRQKE